MHLTAQKRAEDEKLATVQGNARWMMLGGVGLAAGALAAAVGYAYAVEPLRMRLERVAVRLPHARARLPAGGLRILHLSDSHFHGASRNGREHNKIEQIRRLTAGIDYDLLVHTGDFIHYDAGLENVFGLLEAVPCPRLGYYGVLGNHDYVHYAMTEALPRMWRTFSASERARDLRRNLLTRAVARLTRWPRYVRFVRNTPLDGRRTGNNDADRLAAALQDWGMTMLHNRTLHLVDPANDLDCYLAGVEDVVEGRPHLGNTLQKVPEGAPVLLLSHNPDIVASPQLPRVDLVLSGHTHGGQIVLPIWGPTHTQVKYLSRRQVSGSFQVGRTHFYVSRGLGEGIPLRFGAGPQIALITVTT